MDDARIISIIFQTYAKDYKYLDNKGRPDPTWEQLNNRYKTFADITSSSPAITWNIIKSNPERGWCIHYFSRNPNVTWDIVKNNPNLSWCFRSLSNNPSIRWENIKDTPNRAWDNYYVSMNPNVTWDIVKNNPEIPWDYSYLSENPNITWRIVIDNPEIPWNFLKLQFNKYNNRVNNYSPDLEDIFEDFSKWTFEEFMKFKSLKLVPSALADKVATKLYLIYGRTC